jgi:4-hydroxybenzoate polyprenyltransferase
MNRWWIYQKERFPVVKHGLLIAIFSTAAIAYANQLRPNPTAIAPGTVLVAFIVVFLAFLQLRIADEFKDFADDARYRPYRPVPRGLVSLGELRAIGWGCVAVQLGLTLALGWRSLILLAILWLYMSLMRHEFFAPDWLKVHPIAYLLSHMLIMPLLALYASSCDWLRADGEFPITLLWFLAVSYCNGLAIELGRKIRAPESEEPGVETYTALWGRSQAVAAWLGSLWLAALCSIGAAVQIQFWPAIAIGLVLLGIAVILAGRFWLRPTKRSADHLADMAGIWTLLVNLSLGVLPLIKI